MTGPPITVPATRDELTEAEAALVAMADQMRQLRIELGLPAVNEPAAVVRARARLQPRETAEQFAERLAMQRRPAVGGGVPFDAHAESRAAREAHYRRVFPVQAQQAEADRRRLRPGSGR